MTRIQHPGSMQIPGVVFYAAHFQIVRFAALEAVPKAHGLSYAFEWEQVYAFLGDTNSDAIETANLCPVIRGSARGIYCRRRTLGEGIGCPEKRNRRESGRRCACC